jgi:hypothetical protein
MKQLKKMAAFITAAGIIALNSCNSADEKKPEEQKGDTAKSKTETTVMPAPMGPKSVAIIRHKVANYAKWKPLYDSDDSARMANGLHNYVITRGVDDSNNVMVALLMDDVTKAKAFANNPALKDKMKKGGITGAPMVDFLEAVENDTTAIMQTVRVMVRSHVKDWDAWKKVYDSHVQMRTDAGLTQRVLAHTAGDNHMVTLVFAVADLAKAKAFMNSQDLKDRMKEAGTDGPPDIYFYKVAQRY